MMSSVGRRWSRILGREHRVELNHDDLQKTIKIYHIFYNVKRVPKSQTTFHIKGSLKETFIVPFSDRYSKNAHDI